MAHAYAGPDSKLTPNTSDMKAFVSWWFERCNHGMLEIGWFDARGAGLTHFEQFELGDVDALVLTAAQANLVPGQHCYIRASTIHPWGKSSGRTTDMDFRQAPGLWSDMDKAEDLERARTVNTKMLPNASVITGTVPSMRVQSWFRCSDPIVSPEMVRGYNVRLHRLFGGDPSVVNPTRLMRLPGTISWPWKEGRIPELTRLVMPEPGSARPRSYPVASLDTYLPKIEGVSSDAEHLNGTASVDFDFGFPSGGTAGGLSKVSNLIAAIKSGRNVWHDSMIVLVAHWIDRGWSNAEIMGHCPDWTLPGFTVSDTRREVAKAIDGAREKYHVPEVDPTVSPTGVKRHRILTLTELIALPPPKWLVHGLIPEKSLVVPYGPPKSGKTFIILSLGMHIAAGRSWFNHPVQEGAVVYIAGEGTGGMSTRVQAMMTKYGITADVPFFTVRRAVNFTNKDEVNALERDIREAIGALPLRLLIVDTLARAMPGADENSAQEVGAVIAAADYLKEELSCTVALVHHEGKDGTRGARGTSALRGAWDAAYQITGSGKRSKLVVVDQKEAEAGQSLSFFMEEVKVGLSRSSLVPVLDEAGEPEREVEQYEPSGQAGMMLRTLRDLMAGPESAILPPFSDMPTGDLRGIAVLMWRRHVYDKMPTVEADARRQAFHRGMQTLMQRKLINVKDPWVWLARDT